MTDDKFEELIQKQVERENKMRQVREDYIDEMGELPKKQITVKIFPNTHKALKVIAASKDTTIEKVATAIIGDKILSFLVDDIKLSRDNAISIKQRLLEHWQLKFQHNSTEPDASIEKTISKTEFAWPITVFLTDEITPDIDDCLSFVPDIALKKEVESFMRNVNMIHHERFEFANKVIQSYAEYKKTKPAGTKEIEKLFLKEYGKEFYNEFKFDDNEEKTEYLTKLFVYRIITNNININKISSNIGVEL